MSDFQFFHPNRSAPTTTVTISNLESYPVQRPRQRFQYRAETPNGGVRVRDLGAGVQWVKVNIKHLASSDKTSLYNFIVTTCNFAVETFDITDNQGNQYNSCRFWQPNGELDFSQEYYLRFAEQLIIRIPV